MDEAPSYQYDFIARWKMNIQSYLQSTGVWKSMVDGYTPPKNVKSVAQKEAKMNNALALEIIQKNLSKTMKNEMKTITSTKEMWLRLEQIYKEYDKEDEVTLINMIMEDTSDDIKRQFEECNFFEELEKLIFKLQQLEFEELSNTGKYTGNISKLHVDFIEKDCSKVEKCYHGDFIEINNDYNSEKDKSNKLSDLDDRSNMYIESESESENEKSTCYSIDMPGFTDSDFGDDESDKNLENVTLNLVLIFEKFKKNKLINSLREDVMFVVDKVNNPQEQNQALQGHLDESKLKMQKISKTSS